MTNELQKMAKCYKTCLERLKTATRKCKITLKKQNKAPKIQRTFQLWVKYRKRRVRASVDRMLPISTRLFAVLI